MKCYYSITIFIIILISISESKKPVKNYFDKLLYFKELYPGRDPLQMLSINTKMQLMRFILTKTSLYYSNPLKKNKILGALEMKTLASCQSDNLKKGKCCENIKFQNFVSKIARKKGLKTSNRINDILTYNYCLELFIPEKLRWRICSNNSSNLLKLQSLLSYNIISSSKKGSNLIGKYLKNNKLNIEQEVISFDWDSQKKWKGTCRSKFLQSPINFEGPVTKKNDLKVEYKFYNTYVKIVKRFNENIIMFKNNPGLIKISINGNRSIYKPKYISFRFPSEHLVNGKRFAGEIILNCEEIHPDKKRRNSNGLNLTIPLERNVKYKNLKFLESLNIEFWKSNPKKTTHTPTNFITKKKKVFELDLMMKMVNVLKPNFFLYLGSQTVPPCRENVYHLYSDKPLKISNCQFKLFRKNTIISDRAKEIHARLAQNANKRPIYSVNKIDVNYNIEKYIPEEYFELNEEIYNESLLKKKLSNISGLHVLKTLKNIKSNDDLSKIKKKLNKKTFNGVSLDTLISDGDDEDGELNC